MKKAITEHSLPGSDSIALPPSPTAGFFQTPPRLKNQFFDDLALQRVFERTEASFKTQIAPVTLIVLGYVPSSVRSLISPDLSSFGARVLHPRVLRWIADAEAHPPTVNCWDVWGKREDELVTSEGWRKLQEMGISEGIVSIAYENAHGEYSRLYQFLKYHLWTGSCAYVTCPSAMTDGAAKMLSTHINLKAGTSDARKVFKAAYSRLISRDLRDAWTSGQWMTERVGGSDVQNIETLATFSPVTQPAVDGPFGIEFANSALGPWCINGFKWFSSATDANMAIVLARTPDGGISAFYVPMRRTSPEISSLSKSSLSQSSIETSHKQKQRSDIYNDRREPVTESNGIFIQRLKTKLGTRPLPTAELVLEDARAYLLGQQGQGVREISIVLNITRIHNAVTACGLWGRGLAISRAFTQVRSIGGRALMDAPAHIRNLAENHMNYQAYMHFAFFVVALLGVSEQASNSQYQPKNSQVSASITSRIVPPEPSATLILRLLTPVLKAMSAKAAIAGLAECMESLGGVGYLDSSSPSDIETNVARLLRDANVLSIWEGTTDVMGNDTLRVLKGKISGAIIDAFDLWVSSAGSLWEDRADLAELGRRVQDSWQNCKTLILENAEQSLQVQGRSIMNKLGWLVISILLMNDASHGGGDHLFTISHWWVCKNNHQEHTNVLNAQVYKNIVFGTEQISKPTPAKL
ncbi:MAG: hypothetical protein Q9167_000959 [Letrouitia subvulpina]